MSYCKVVIKKAINYLKYYFIKIYAKILPTDSCYITCSGKTDGAGAQIQAVLSTILFANEMGIKYIHSPFKKIEQIYQNIKGPWEEKWEEFVNLGFHELSINNIDIQKLNKIYLHPDDIWKIRKVNNRLYVIKHCHNFVDKWPNLYSTKQVKFISKYESSSKNTKLYFDNSKINIAVHIRRGNVSKALYNDKYTDDEFVIKVIEQIISASDDLNLPIAIHIFSLGEEKYFLDFDKKNIILHINNDPFAAFHHLVLADILVMAKSSFSYSAALLSRGIKIYEPFRHPPLKEWLVIDRNGRLDIGKLKKMLQEHHRLHL